MLPKNLISGSFKRGKIIPSYLHDTHIAEELISIFRDFEGKKYDVLRNKLKSFEEDKHDFKIIRGLAELLKRRCEFHPNSSLDSKEVRTFLFDHGFVLNEEKRKEVLKAAADHFGVSEQEIEEAIFMDLLKEQIFTIPDPPTPQELIRSYNLSLIQTLLFNAVELTFTVFDNFQQIFRMINYLGLMYEIEDKKIKVFGPLSILKKTRKYGTSLAKLIPLILRAEKWSLEAKILMNRGNQPKIFTFELNSAENILFPKYNEFTNDKIFDSEVEKKFYNEFKIFAPDWEIKREPTFIKAGNHVIIPDFGFFKNGIKLYLEVVGFWTEAYIKRKIEKFKQTEEEILIALNKNLKCSREDFNDEVIMYDKWIPIKPILKILKKMEQEQVQKILSELNSVNISEDIINLRVKARQLNIIPEALKELRLPNHFLIGEILVSRKFLSRLKEEIGDERDFSKIKIILNKYGLTNKALDL
ncbi:MAG: DUF790 family protein, partial [Promethearchaeota archaeon]